MPAPDPSPAPSAVRCFALIPSAGVGARARAAGQGDLPKQYQALCGQPVLAHTLAAFQALGAALQGLAVVVSPEDEWIDGLARGAGVTVLRQGGATRADSVRQGLAAWMAQPRGPGVHDWVLVHDAARCLVTPAQIERLMQACREDAVGGLLALPLADTLKAEQGGRVAGTLERAGRWLAQTPQMFRAASLLQALSQAAEDGLAVTDEASALEAQGLQPLLVAASAQNFKITYPEDFELAAAILRARQPSSSAKETP